MSGMNKYRLLKPILIVMMLLASAHVVSANDTDGDVTDDAMMTSPTIPVQIQIQILMECQTLSPMVVREHTSWHIRHLRTHLRYPA